MMWSSWSDFLAMGGYGLYVWGSMAACLLVCLIEPMSLNLKRRALLAGVQGQGAPENGQSSS